MFQDEIRLSVRGGKGGDGMICFFREKYRPKGGPAGGDGGDGGDVVIVASHDVHGFHGLRGRKRLKAPIGMPGGVAQMGGKDGEDLIVKVPVGTEIRDAGTGLLLKDLAENSPDPLPAQYVDAMKRLLPSLSTAHLAMLKAHYRAADRSLTATELAKAAGYSGYASANLQYGLMARNL